MKDLFWRGLGGIVLVALVIGGLYCGMCGEFFTGAFFIVAVVVLLAIKPKKRQEPTIKRIILHRSLVSVLAVLSVLFFLGHHTNYSPFRSYWEHTAKESPSKIENIACKKPFDSRAGVCTFGGSQSELDKIVIHLGLKEIVTHSVTPPKDEHGNPISGLKGGDLPQSFGCKDMKEFSVVGFTGNMHKAPGKDWEPTKVRYLRPEVHVYTPSDPEYYGKWHDEDGLLNRYGVHFQTLYYNSQSQPGCVDLNHPWG